MAISAMLIVILTMSSWTFTVTSVSSITKENKSVEKPKLEIKATERLLTGPIQSGTEIAGNIISSLGNEMISCTMFSCSQKLLLTFCMSSYLLWDTCLDFLVSPVLGDSPEPLLYNKDPKDLKKINCAKKDEFKRRWHLIFYQNNMWLCKIQGFHYCQSISWQIQGRWRRLWSLWRDQYRSDLWRTVSICSWDWVHHQVQDRM